MFDVLFIFIRFYVYAYSIDAMLRCHIDMWLKLRNYKNAQLAFMKL